jgi:hypothetical protein
MQRVALEEDVMDGTVGDLALAAEPQPATAGNLVPEGTGHCRID